MDSSLNVKIHNELTDERIVCSLLDVRSIIDSVLTSIKEKYTNTEFYITVLKHIIDISYADDYGGIVRCISISTKEGHTQAILQIYKELYKDWIITEY